MTFRMLSHFCSLFIVSLFISLGSGWARVFPLEVIGPRYISR